MIPNVFISSTVADLRYLRDALRDAVQELCYCPVMSDYGEVGYLAPVTAAQSCYRTVAECHIVVLIVGQRYGHCDKDGISVTHKEFLTAQEKGLPVITFIETDVIAFEKLFDVDPHADLWGKFKGMDNPEGTFRLLKAIRASQSFNGCIPFGSAAEVKELLKQQIAHFVCLRLNEIVRPLKSEVQELFAEVKMMRQELKSQHPDTPEIERYGHVLRLLLDDRSAGFRKFLEALFMNLDTAVPVLLKHDQFSEIPKVAGYSLEIEKNAEVPMEVLRDPKQHKLLLTMASGGDGFYIVTRDKRVILNELQMNHFERIMNAIANTK